MYGINSMLNEYLTIFNILVDILLIATVFKLWSDMSKVKIKLKNVSTNLDIVDEISNLKKKVKSLLKTKYIKNRK